MIAEKIYDLLPEEWPKVIGDLPATNNVAVGIMEYSGNVSTEYFGPQTGCSIVSPVLKIVVRHNSYETGQQWSEQIKQTLHRYHDDALLSVLMVGSPVYLGRSTEKLHEFQVTFSTQVKE